MNSAFIAKMEHVLWLYQQVYDPEYPVVCFDERPCFHIGDLVEPISMQTGNEKKSTMAMRKKVHVLY